MQALGSRRGGLLTLLLVAAALVAAATLLIFQFAERPSVTAMGPQPGVAVATPRATVSFAVDGEDRLSDLAVTVDGRDVTARVRVAGGRVQVPVAGLDDGIHAVAVRFSTDNLFARTVRADWTFEVDTVAPPLTVTAPVPDTTSSQARVRFRGVSEPGATVTIAAAGGDVSTTAGPRGGWTAVATLPEGPSATAVTASDRAGNTTGRRRSHRVDTSAPTIRVSAPAGDEPLTVTDQPLIYGSVVGDNPRALTYAVVVNGTVVARADGRGAAVAEDGLDSEAATLTVANTSDGAEDTPLTLAGRSFTLAPGTLPQGRNDIAVVAADAAGNRGIARTSVIVDSTDEFGETDLVRGARGGDVVQLQEILRGAGVYPRRAEATGVFDTRTLGAVKRYQKGRDLPITGRVDARMRQALVGRIVISLEQRKLRLIRDGAVVKTYRIAIGTPSHPTPTGDYEIIDKQVDPTWFPPDSPWAEGLGPIAPGPGNPLGTRWIGTSAPAIGIHGTYDDGSIGTAASHGCLRMHIPEVEELYEMVTHGMKVSIRA